MASSNPWPLLRFTAGVILTLTSAHRTACGDGETELHASPLRVGGRVVGRVVEDSEIVDAPGLARLGNEEPVRGVRFNLDLDESSTVTIDLTSYLFDAYLLLTDAAGAVLDEDDDGLVGTQSRIVASLVPGRYGVIACARHLDVGAFDLHVEPDERLSLDGAARLAADLEDARETVRIRESERGADHLSTARAIELLAFRLEAESLYADAEAAHEHALSIREGALGDEHPETARSLNFLCLLHRRMGRYSEAESLCRRALGIRQTAFGEEHPKTAQSLANLAQILVSQGRHADAEPLYERALRTREKSLGTDHKSIASTLNNLGLLYRSQGRYSDAEPLLKRALEIRRSWFGEDHPSTVVSLSALALLYESQGRYSDAEPLLVRALEISQRAVGAEHPKTATRLNNLASLYWNQGRHHDAEPLMVRALKICERSLGEEHPTTVICMGNLAGLYRVQGKYGHAAPLYRRAAKTSEATLGGDHPATATSLHNLGLFLKAQGRYDDAERAYLRALEVRERVLGPTHPSTATTVGNLAVLYRAMGRVADAEPLYRRAIEINEAVLGAEHPTTASSLNDLAGLFESQGRHADAESLYRRAFEIRRIALGEGHPLTATTLNDLALLFHNQGRKEESEETYLRSIEIEEEALGANHPSVASTLKNLAGLYISQGRYAEAAERLERALEIRRTSLGESHPQTGANLHALAVLHHRQAQLELAEPLYRRALENFSASLGDEHPQTAACRAGLVELSDSLGRHADALSLAIALLDGRQSWIARELLRSPNQHRFAVASAQRDSIFLALTQWSAHAKPKPVLDDVYRRICAWKGIVFRSATRIARELASRTGDPALHDLRTELADLDGMLSVLSYAARIRDPEAHEARLTDLRARRSGVQNEILVRLDLKPAREKTDGAELGRLLPERAAVLDFLIHRPMVSRLVENETVVREERWGDPRVLCFVTASGASEPTLVDLGSAARLRTATMAWLERLGRERRGRPVAATEEDPSVVMGTLLFEPLRRALPNDVTRLFVIPAAFLGEIPFGALPVGGGRYLLEAVDVVYATDPVTLRDLLEGAPTSIDAAPSILAVGHVDYDARSDVPPSLAVVDTEVARTEDRGGQRAFSRGWGPLAGTAEEIDGLIRRAARLDPEAEPPRVLRGPAATERAVKSEIVGRTIVHLATHGFYEREGLVSLWEAALERAHEDRELMGFAALSEPSNPWRDRAPFAGVRPLEGEEPGLLAGLAFAGVNLGTSESDEIDDGILTATEAATLDLSSCRLAVLSACQSSLGSGRSGEGLQSMRRGFHEAGVSSVIASLWKVDDVATQRLMRVFYEEYLTNRRSVGDALRRARLRLLQERRDPYFWGAFTLSGEWR